jgi:hypothetical protein
MFGQACGPEKGWGKPFGDSVFRTISRGRFFLSFPLLSSVFLCVSPDADMIGSSANVGWRWLSDWVGVGEATLYSLYFRLYGWNCGGVLLFRWLHWTWGRSRCGGLLWPSFRSCGLSGMMSLTWWASGVPFSLCTPCHMKRELRVLSLTWSQMPFY